MTGFFVLGDALLGNTTTTILLVIVVLVMMFFVSMLILLSRQYKRCPSNKILLIYGKTNHVTAIRAIHGGAAFVVPLLQDFAYLSLEPIRIPLRCTLPSDTARLNLHGNFTVAISSESEVIKQAAKRLLGLSHDDIRELAEEIIVVQLRQHVHSVGIEEVFLGPNTLSDDAQGSLESELNQVGLQLISANITDLIHESEDRVTTQPV